VSSFLERHRERRERARRLRQLGVIAPVLFVVSVLCTWSEALIFLPGASTNPAGDLVGALVLYVIEAVALAILAAGLGLTRESGARVARRPLAATLLMLLACGVAYAVYYLVFGAITYQFFTKGYYPEAEDVVRRLGLWLWVIQIGRGVLMTLAVLPAIHTLRLPRGPAGVGADLSRRAAHDLRHRRTAPTLPR